MDSSLLDFLKNVLQLGTALVALVSAVFTGVLTSESRSEVEKKIQKSNMSPDDKNFLKKGIRRWKVSARISWGALLVASLIALGLFARQLIYPATPVTLPQLLSANEPALFPVGSSTSVEIARVFTDRNSVLEGSNLAAIIRSTNGSFDLLAEHGSSVIRGSRSSV